MIYLPGGKGTRTLKNDSNFIEWLKTAADVPYKVSVCTGSLLLGAAGFLTNKKATSHPTAYDLLSMYTDKVVQERIVRDAFIFTGGGVSSSIDLGLYICEVCYGIECREKIQKQMDYPYYIGANKEERLLNER